MLKRKIASDAPHVTKAKEFQLKKVDQINVYPEFLRPDIIEVQVDNLKMVIDQLDPSNFEYDEIRSEYYSEWSDDELADYRESFLKGVVLPKLEAMMGGDQKNVDIIVNDLMSMSEEGGASLDLNPILEIIVKQLYDGKYNDGFAFYMAERFLLGITRKNNLRHRAFMMMLDLFRHIAGEDAKLGLENFFAEKEGELNAEGRSFFRENKRKLSSKSFNDLILFANHLDSKGLRAEADALDLLIQKSAEANELGLKEVLKEAEGYGFRVTEKAKELTEDTFKRLIDFYSGTSKLEDILSVEDEDKASDILDTQTDNPDDTPKNKSKLSIVRTSFKAAKESFLYIKNSPNNIRKFLSVAFSALMAAGYIVLPIDIIPDALIGIGWVDDILSFSFILRFVASKIDSSGWNNAITKNGPNLIELQGEEGEA